MTERPQKITFGEMREMGVRGVLVYCVDYKCSHWIAVSPVAHSAFVGDLSPESALAKSR